MRQVNIHEAKTHLSRLVEDAGRGETIILAKAGKPIAKIVSLDTPERDSAPSADLGDLKDKPNMDWGRFGFMKGKLFVPDDFDTAHQDEIIRMFEGEE